MKILIFAVVLFVVILLWPSNADANPGSVRPSPDGTWLGQRGTASNGLATFWTTVLGVRAAGKNAIALYSQGNTTYQAFGDAWSGNASNYALAVAEANGEPVNASFTISNPFALAALLHGIFVAEYTTDPTNYLQRLVGATWALL